MTAYLDFVTEIFSVVRVPNCGSDAASVRDDSDGGAEDQQPPVHVLLIEDDAEIADDVVRACSQAGYHVEVAGDGRQGLTAAQRGGFDVILIDRMLPGLDGLTVLGGIRQAELRTPVLLMSALDSVEERVRGLRAGGDDYLVKPFSLVELMARLEALLRRPLVTASTALTVGPLRADLITRSVQRGQREIILLPREFKLLVYMMRRPGQVLTRAMLLEQVWAFRFMPETNVVDVHMGKLRKKIDTDGETAMIQSVRGAGFILLGD